MQFFNFFNKVTVDQVTRSRSSFPDMNAPENLRQEKDLEKEDIIQQEENILETFGIILDQKFGWEIALLFVEQNDEKYRLRYIHASAEPEETQFAEFPRLSFSNHQKYEHYKPRDIIGAMQTFSLEQDEPREFRIWFNQLTKKLEKKYNKKLSCLIINDKTDFEIPWEMLYVKNDEDILGASIPVVRWQDIPNYNLESCNRTMNLQIKNDNCCGNILAYINTKDFTHTKREIEMIENYHKVCRHTTLKSFLEELKQTESNVSVLFIASHGYFEKKKNDEGKDIFNISLGECDTNNRLSLMELKSYKLKFLKKSASVVFINSCHSGRLHREEKYNYSAYRQGFVTCFLQKGAKGVIGTLEEVQDLFAAQISNNFFEIYRKDPSQSVPEILCNLRKNALEKLNSLKNEENNDIKEDYNSRLFIDTFKYVYYGNPMTILDIKSAGE